VAIQKWRAYGPKPLNGGAWDVDGTPLDNPGPYNSGIWLFVDRQNISHFFPPNFLPPYTTPEKRKLIMDVLKDEWDEASLSWKPVGFNSKAEQNFGNFLCGVVNLGESLTQNMFGDAPPLIRSPSASASPQTSPAKTV